MSLPISPTPRSHTPEKSAPDESDVCLEDVSGTDDDEVTDVMDRKDLPDFTVEGENDAPRTPRNRPSTFTRLLLDKRQS